MLQETMWVTKFSVLLVGIFSTIAVPSSRDFVLSTLPAIWTFVRIFLVPPYLFLTVNFIIVVIWVLSEKMHHHQCSEKKPEHTIEVASLTPTKIIRHHYLPVTVDAQLYSSTSSSETPAATELEVRSCTAADPEETPTGEKEAISLDATWEVIVGGGKAPARKAVLTKTDTWEMAASVGSPHDLGGRAHEMKKSETFSESRQRARVLRKDVVVLGNDELNRKFEAFIKKVNDQIRLQRQESYQRYVNLISRGTNYHA